jgi:hypothetical protein
MNNKKAPQDCSATPSKNSPADTQVNVLGSDRQYTEGVGEMPEI